MDGREDRIEISTFPTGDPPEVEARLLIELSRRSAPIKASLVSPSGHVSAYAGDQPGELIIDYTNRSSRDAPELVYDVYRWDSHRSTLCLFASADGVPTDHLSGERGIDDLQITHFEGCSEFGDEASAVARTEPALPERRLSAESGPVSGLCGQDPASARFSCHGEHGGRIVICEVPIQGDVKRSFRIEIARVLDGPESISLGDPDSPLHYNHYSRFQTEYLEIAASTVHAEYRVYRHYLGDLGDVEASYGLVVTGAGGDEVRVECAGEVLDRLSTLLRHLECDTANALGCGALE